MAFSLPLPKPSSSSSSLQLSHGIGSSSNINSSSSKFIAITNIALHGEKVSIQGKNKDNVNYRRGRRLSSSSNIHCPHHVRRRCWAQHGTANTNINRSAHAQEEEEEEEEEEGISSSSRRRRRIGGGGSRHKKKLVLALVMCLCNADRVVMSVAVVPLSATHSWSSSFLGIVQSSYLWGYMVSSCVGGALADGSTSLTRKVMGCGVALWSLATFLTPWAARHSTTWGLLLSIRALFGLAQGVAIPCMNILLSRWFPSDERASAVGFCMAGFHLGNLVGFLASPIMIAKIGISGVFALFSAVGFLLLSLWAAPWIVDDDDMISSSLPTAYDDSMSSSTSSPSLKQLLSKLPSWAIIFANITNNWGYFVLLSWMPVYFKTVFDVNLKQAAWFSAVPWGLMATSGYVAGLSSDYMIKRGYPVTLVRKFMQSIGFIGPGVALLCLNFARTPSLAAALLTVGLSLSSFSQAGFLLNMQDIAPNCAGLLHGISNSFGTLAAIVSTIGTGYFVEWLGSIQAFLTLTSALYFATVIFWNCHATADQVFF